MCAHVCVCTLGLRLRDRLCPSLLSSEMGDLVLENRIDFSSELWFSVWRKKAFVNIKNIKGQKYDTNKKKTTDNALF